MIEKSKSIWTRLWSNEEGQATTEYLLMLSMAVTIGLVVVNNFIKPVFAKLAKTLDQVIQTRLFGVDMHTFPIRKP